jgi:hypothetical protein
MFSRNSLVVLALLALLLPLWGCSGSVPNYAVSGHVTYAGKPLTQGSIAFEPTDGERPDPRPTTGAEIVDGAFQTPAGKGIGAGSYIVRIYPPMPRSGEKPAPGSYFSPYETKVDFPKEAATRDFTVPTASPTKR